LGDYADHKRLFLDGRVCVEKRSRSGRRKGMSFLRKADH
jgi:hypothetical protein